MPERKFKDIRIDCEEIQGEGSYVILARPSWRDIKSTREFGDDPEDEDNFESALNLITRLFKEWNWVDSENSPLPGPNEDEDAIHQLPMGEQSFLVDKFVEIGREKEKN